MSHRIVCDSCDERVKVGESCVDLCVSDEAGRPTTTHYHDLCWERQMDVLLPRPSLSTSAMIRKRVA